MSSTFTASGPSGEIRVGGRVIGRLGAWRLIPAGGGEYTITGAAVEVNEFLMFEESRKELRLPVGAREWRWRSVSVGYDGSQLMVTVTGKPEVY